LNQVWKIKWRHLANDCGSNAPRFWQRENVQFIEPNMARRGSSPKILRRPGLWASTYHHKHYVGDKKTGKPSKICGPTTNWGGGGWAPWPQRRTAPACGHRIARI